MPAFIPPSLIFFCNSILFISLFTRLPAIQDGMGVDKGMLGLALLGAPLGTFMALPLAGRITLRLSPRKAAPLFLALCALITPAMSVVSYAGFVICFMLFGFCRTLLDVSANMISAGIERTTGQKVMSRCHGFWSVGLLAGTLASGYFSGRDIGPFAHQVAASCFVLICCIVILMIVPVIQDEKGQEQKGRSPVFVMPSRQILLICLMIFGVCIVEGAIYDWGIFYIQEIMGATPRTAAILFSGFTIGMGITRMLGDRLRDLFPARRLVRGSAICVAFGLLLMLFGPGLAYGATGLFLIGCGVALIIPLAISIVIALPGRPAAENLAALSFTLLMATLGVPPLLGMVAKYFGIFTSFAILLPFVLLTFLMSPVSDGRWPTLFPRRWRNRRQG